MNFDDMTLDEIVGYFKDKRFFDYNCNDPQWNNALVRIREKYGEVRPDPRTGFQVNYGLHDDAKTKETSEGS